MFVKDNLQGDNFSMAALKQTPKIVGKINRGTIPDVLQQLPWQPEQITLI